MNQDLDALRARVQREVASFVYSVPNRAIGNPMSSDDVKRHVDELRASLVSPYVARIVLRDSADQIIANPPITMECPIVADDGTHLVFYDDSMEDFGLAQRDLGDNLETIGVRGDVVGVFMAR